MSEISELVTSLAGAGVVAGGGIAWLWAKVERNAKRAKAEVERAAKEAKAVVDKRFMEIEVKLQACESREIEAHARRGKHLIVIEMLFTEVKRLTAGQPSPVLTRAKTLLKELRDHDDDER